MPFTFAPPRDGGWILSSAPPPDWAELIRELGGTFFHTAPGLRVGAPDGNPLYAVLRRGAEARALALGVRAQCRLSDRPLHAYFPSPPVARPGVDVELAMRRLAATLQRAGIAEARWDSFDAASVHPPAGEPTRFEYLVTLADLAAPGQWPPGSTHRRTIRRGERDGWTLRELTGDAGIAALRCASGMAIERATRRGDPFAADLPPVLWDPVDPATGGTWITRAAFAGDTLLAAILVGRSPAHAFYVMGGATTEGYALGASTWLQARTMSELAAVGVRTYNLGGVPRGALDPGDPAHGLHRFKSGFGAQVIGCRNERWDLRPAHLWGHRLFAWGAHWVQRAGVARPRQA